MAVQSFLKVKSPCFNQACKFPGEVSTTAAHPADGALLLLLFAGLFEAWQFQPGEWQTTFTIITTAANRKIEPIHDRMPVILDEAGAADWMNWREPDPLSLKRLLVPAPDDLLVVRPASPLVNSVKNEGPELLEDLSLFGQ